MTRNASRDAVFFRYHGVLWMRDTFEVLGVGSKSYLISRPLCGCWIMALNPAERFPGAQHFER
jgi:hypothetical protein